MFIKEIYKHKKSIVRAILVLAILTFLVFTYDIVRISLVLGESFAVNLAGSIAASFSYLIVLALAILVISYLLVYPGFIGIKTFSTLVILIYGFNFVLSIVDPHRIGDTITYTLGQFIFSLCILSLGLVLAIWTMVYFKKMGEIYIKSDE